MDYDDLYPIDDCIDIIESHLNQPYQSSMPLTPVTPNVPQLTSFSQIQQGSVLPEIYGRIVRFAFKNFVDKKSGVSRNMVIWSLKDQRNILQVKIFFSNNYLDYMHKFKLGDLVHLRNAEVSVVSDFSPSVGEVPMNVIYNEGCDLTESVLSCEGKGKQLQAPMIMPWELDGICRTKFINELPVGNDERWRICLIVRKINQAYSIDTKKGKSLKRSLVCSDRNQEEILVNLWNDHVHFADLWVANQTVLLITCFQVQSYNERKTITVGHRSIIEIDPEYKDSLQLRVLKLEKQELDFTIADLRKHIKNTDFQEITVNAIAYLTKFDIDLDYSGYMERNSAGECEYQIPVEFMDSTGELKSVWLGNDQSTKLFGGIKASSFAVTPYEKRIAMKQNFLFEPFILKLQVRKHPHLKIGISEITRLGN